MNVDPTVLLALVAELYATTVQQQARITELESQVATAEKPQGPEPSPVPSSPEPSA